MTSFAGQRAEGFYVDLGSIFDLADLRPFQNLHLIPTPAQPGVNGTQGYNVHSIAIQVPKKLLTKMAPIQPIQATLTQSSASIPRRAAERQRLFKAMGRTWRQDHG